MNDIKKIKYDMIRSYRKLSKNRVKLILDTTEEVVVERNEIPEMFSELIIKGILFYPDGEREIELDKTLLPREKIVYLKNAARKSGANTFALVMNELADFFLIKNEKLLFMHMIKTELLPNYKEKYGGN